MSDLKKSLKSQTQLKWDAQDELLYWMSNAFVASVEAGKDQKFINEMQKQYARVRKLFGYEETE